MSDPRQDALLAGDFAETRTDDLNAPVEWRGLPEFRPVTRDIRLVLSFDTAEERDRLVEQLGLVISKKTGTTWSAWWPPRDREDLAALRFDFGAPAAAREGAQEPLGEEPADDGTSEPEPPGDSSYEPTAEEIDEARAALADEENDK
jgi:hypothetical protein